MCTYLITDRKPPGTRQKTFRNRATNCWTTLYKDKDKWHWESKDGQIFQEDVRGRRLHWCHPGLWRSGAVSWDIFTSGKVNPHRASFSGASPGTRKIWQPMLCFKAQKRSSGWGCLWRRIQSLRLPQIGPVLLNEVQHAPRPWWGWNCLRRRRRCWCLSPTRRVRFWLSARWRRRRILSVKPQLRMPALKHLRGEEEVEEEVGWGDYWPSSWCWLRRKVCLCLACSPSRRPIPGSPRGRSWGGCRRNLLLRCWAGRVSRWWRRRRMRWRMAWWTWRRRRRGASVWGLRLAVQPLLRRGALSLRLLIQLLILSSCRPCPPLPIFLHPHTFGSLCTPPHLSTHLHHVAWCLDTSGWFVAPVILGAVSSWPNCICQIPICVLWLDYRCDLLVSIFWYRALYILS